MTIDDILAHEKHVRRTLVPFAALVGLLLIGFIVALIYVYR